MSNSDSEMVRFRSVEVLSLYTTMVLKRLVTAVQPVEWRLNNMDGPDKGIIAYDTLLLVIFLKLGVDKLWMTRKASVHNSIVMEELAFLYYPKRPTFALKHLNQCHGLFDYLSSHSPDLEEVYIPRSDVTAFQNCMKFKNLRVLELDGRISDKVLCGGLWNIHKKSDKVLEMALKETKGLDSWLLSLPHLEVLRNNFIDQHSKSMRVSFGAAAMLIQPKMEAVEVVTSWDTTAAIMYLLDAEAKMKNGSTSDRKFQLKRLMIFFIEDVDKDWLWRLFRACPCLNTLCLLESEKFLCHLDVFIELFQTVPLRKLELDTKSMKPLHLAALLVATPNLTDLTLHTTPVDLAEYHSLPNKTTCSCMNLPPALESLTLNFATTEINHEKGVCERFLEEFRQMMKSFLSKFASVKTLNLFSTSCLPASYLVFGGIEAALEELVNLKQLSVIACDYRQCEDNQSDEDVDHNSSFFEHLYGPPHYSKVRLLLPLLQREETFPSLCKLEFLELDSLYLSPRVDRMVAALRASGVLVNTFTSGNMYPINEYLINKTDKKKYSKYVKLLSSHSQYNYIN
ncbi:uncharacterized protein LOC123513603 isoform X2 [Portunus trituberculatus]|uniref:uncharacterized protein LOC123513603 isoform X2 n=1 Tax=Portunus trituberculatus TaxID=210409 RepID=UPI001E1CF286|nr:uncharacterized protein LOC123513603 isoform X2 [Portunus trituberculatus]